MVVRYYGRTYSVPVSKYGELGLVNLIIALENAVHWLAYHLCRTRFRLMVRLGVDVRINQW